MDLYCDLSLAPNDRYILQQVGKAVRDGHSLHAVYLHIFSRLDDDLHVIDSVWLWDKVQSIYSNWVECCIVEPCMPNDPMRFTSSV